MSDLVHALAEFKRAAAKLAEEWEAQPPGDPIENYPDYLPSFDEFVADVFTMYVPPAVEAGDMSTTDGLPGGFPPPLDARQIPGTPRHN